MGLHTFRSYRQRLTGERRSYWTRLAISRVLCWLIVAVIATRPALTDVTETTEKSKAIILVDTSDSMDTRDVVDNTNRQSRLNAIRDALQRHGSTLEAIQERLIIEQYDFANGLIADGATDGSQNKQGTAIGTTLESIRQRNRGGRVHRIIMLTDGRNNRGHPLSDALSHWTRHGVPIDCVQVGQMEYRGTFSDALLTDLRSPPVVESGKALAIDVTGVYRGLAGHTGRIRALVDGQDAALRERAITTHDEQFRETLTIPTSDLAPGYHRLRVELVPANNEVALRNNHMELFFYVKSHGIRVLYLETVIRPEYKFLKRLLESNSGLTVTTKSPFWLRTPAGNAFIHALSLVDYDVFIIGDVSRSTLPQDAWNALQQLVHHRAAGIVLIAGANNLRPEFWRHNPVADCLPVVPTDWKTEITEFVPLPSTDRRHFIIRDLTRLTAQWPDRPWRGLRNTAIRRRPQSEALFIDHNEQPLLVVGEYYRGRTAAWLTDATWHWKLDSQVPLHLYEHIWNRLLYWLAAREDNLNARLAILTSTSRIDVGSELTVTASFMDQHNVSVSDALVTVTVSSLTNPNMTASTLMSYENGAYVGQFPQLLPGNYRIAAEANYQGETISSNELRISVEPPRLEDEDVLADAATLRRISEQTRGRLRQLDGLPELIETLPEGAKVVTVRQTESTIPLWDRWWILAAAIGVLTFEWWQRRVIGLP